MSNTIIFAGTKNDKGFCVSADADKVVAALEVAALGESGWDIEHALAKLDGLVKECATAISWEAEDTIKTFITIIKSNGRFAVCHRPVVFGVGTTHQQALDALTNEEF